MDGRVRRGELNRAAIVDAALHLLAEEGTLPTAQAIAERARVAKRSVFHHFPDMEALLIEAAQSQAARYWSVLSPPEADRTLAERIRMATDQRAELFEAIGDVRRVAVLYEPGWPLLASRMEESRSGLRRHLRRALSPELSRIARPAAEGVLAVGSWEMWEVLRRHHGLSPAGAVASVRTTIEAAFEQALVRED